MKGLFLLWLSLLPVVVIQAQTVTDTTVYQLVEEMPQFPGGDEALLKWLVKNMKYPEMDTCIETSLYLEFVISPTGKVTKAGFMRECRCKSFCDAFLKQLATMPDWTPGRKNGQPVNVKMSMPIKLHPR